jgi:hypothetical protein
LTDSVILEENDSAFIGRVPFTFVVDTVGRIHLADETTDRLYVFSGHGRLERVIGRHGQGPGEFMGIDPVTIRRDGVIIQQFQGNTLSAIRDSDGIELGRVHVRGYLSTAASTPRHLVLGLFGAPTRPSVAVVSWDSLWNQRSTDAIEPTMIPVPDDYLRYPGLEIYNQVIVSINGDSLLVGFGGLPYLVAAGIDGSWTDTIVLPYRQRRGATYHQLERLRATNLTFHEGVTAVSNLKALWRRRDGHVVIWHQDGGTEDPARGNAEITGQAYISVLRPDLTEVCADALVEAPGNHRTRLAFARDTLFSLDQLVDSVRGQRPSATTVVRKYTIGTADCEWASTLVR